jgi:hypothetical protein
MKDIFCNGRDMRSPSISKESMNNFIAWLQENYQKRILYGDPVSWFSHLKRKR